MTHLKILLVSCLMATVFSDQRTSFFSPDQTRGNGSTLIGLRQPNGRDFVMKQEQVYVKKPLVFGKAKKTVTLEALSGKTISAIEIVNTKQETTPASWEITAGGLGHAFVTINFIQNSSHGIHYQVLIYGSKYE